MTRAGRILGILATVLVASGSVPRPPTEVPVLLIPGWFDTERDLAALRIRLISAGWPTIARLTMTPPT